jgi:serine/threonine protein kinase
VLATIGSRIIYDLRQKATQFGQYTLGRPIGHGGMGEVYMAEHALLKRRTAIKVILEARLDATTLRRFEQEVKAMSRLTHPNSVAVFDYGHSTDGRLYYAMEYLDGLDLARLRGAQPIDRVVKIASQVAGALEEAHGKGLIHRDIKPGNIILCRHGGMLDVVKVVDYGLVEEMKRNAKSDLMGTPGYIAPEALTGDAAPATDLFALGAVAYLLLTGKPVFDGSATAELLAAALEQKPKPLPANVPPALAEIVMKLLAKDPKARYASAGELAQALEGVPKQGDWTREHERAWWADFAAKQAATPSPDDKTVTLAIDYDKRD